jgi:hypothetical protein
VSSDGSAESPRTAPGSLAVVSDVQARNREVLDAVRVRRDDLYEAVLGLERTLAVPAGDSPDAWAAMLAAPVARLQEVLGAHVRGTEGPRGLFDRMREDAPHLLNAVDRLRIDHAAMVLEADALAARLGEVTTDDDVHHVRDQSLDLLRHVLEHRHQGAEIVYDAYQVDVSAAD